ncbi:hypothetical protein ABIA30_003636 [Mycobacterium sp. MAA66]|uniref:hypothetical protein n=1 Tax=Mycobacterium sp. MAA66 TaxID=3156297 RepID=UPI0035175B3F
MGTTLATNDQRDIDPIAHRGASAADGGQRHHYFGRVIAAGAIGLAALSVVLAAPAAAHGSPHSDNAHHHSVTSSAHAQQDSAHPQHSRGAAATPPASGTGGAVANPAAGDPTSGAPAGGGGHDKCKRAKNGQVPPWCTDPAAGWGSTLHRAEGGFPTMSSAKSNSSNARAAAGRVGAHR